MKRQNFPDFNFDDFMTDAMDNMEKIYKNTNKTFDENMRSMDNKFNMDINTESFHMKDKLRISRYAIQGALLIFAVMMIILVWGMFSSYKIEEKYEPKNLTPPAIEKVEPIKPGSMKKL